MFDIDSIRYALSKQLGTAQSIETSYGPIHLDPELAAAVEEALRPIAERRLKQLETGGIHHG